MSSLAKILKNCEEKLRKIFSLWKEIGVEGELLAQRQDTLSWHLGRLLDDMFEEETCTKDALLEAVRDLELKISELDVGLCEEKSCDFTSMPLLLRERSLYNEYKSLCVKSSENMKNFELLSRAQENLCRRLGKSPITISFKKAPSTSQLAEIRAKIVALEEEKNARLNDLNHIRDDILAMSSSLGPMIVEDGLLTSIASIQTIDLDTTPLNDVFFVDLKNCQRTLREKIATAEEEYDQNTSRIADMQSRMSMHIVSLDDIARGKLFEILEKTRSGLKELESLRRENLKTLLQAAHEELLRLQDACFVLNNTNLSSELLELNPSEDLLDKLEAEVRALKVYRSEKSSIISAFRKWQTNFVRFTEAKRKLGDPAVLINRGGVLLKIERECNALRQRVLPEHETLIQELLANPEGRDFRVFNQPVLEYIASSWANLNIENPGVMQLRRAKMTPSNKSGSLLSLKIPSDSKNLKRHPEISGHLTGSTISLMHDFGASGGSSQRFIKSANRIGSTTSLLTPRSNNKRSKVVPASTGCRRKPGANLVPAPPSSLSVKDLFLRPQEPATPLHRNSVYKGRSRTSTSARAQVFKTPKTAPRTHHVMQTRLSCRMFSAKTPDKS